MPRASSSGKRQQGSSSIVRDQRNDNGLVSPAKRTTSRKSNGQTDGSARSADPVAGRAGPSSPSSISLHCQANGNSAKTGVDAFIEPRPSHVVRRSSLGTCSEASSDSAQSNASANGNVMDSGVRQIDVSAMKTADVHKDSGPFELAATIVRSLPIQDTLAILIILMHVPYLSLSLIYASFALITFVPPVTTKTGMNINLAEILDNTSHTPSLITILCMDFFFFLFWVFLWQPIQDSILEFAKPVIAITVGGGTDAKDGTSRGVTTCFAWILLHQAMRATRSHWARLARHLPEDWSVPSFLVDSFEQKPMAYHKRSTHGWIQSTLAMHILTQGIVRFVREWYLKREKAHAASGTGDPEAAGKLSASGNASVTASSASHAGDSAQDGGSSAADADSLLPAASATSSKRRRKQNAQVRLQQPLWAALASSKIVAVKEYELSQWAADSTAVDASDIHNPGSAFFDGQPRQIWISYIGSDEVCFNTSSFPDPMTANDAPARNAADVVLPAGVDASKPFYVRINNAYWQPTRISPVQSCEDNQDHEAAHQGPRWTGDIYALRPTSTYLCEFVDIETGDVVLSTTIRTGKEMLRENEAMSPSPVFPPGQQALRPDSPATIIKNSTAAEEARLSEERSRLKTFRKDSKTKINSMKKDNEQFESQLAAAGGSDEKHRQKIRQFETQKAQAERDADLLEEQLSTFDNEPELGEQKRKLDKAYAAEKMLFDTLQKDFKDFESKLDGEIRVKELEKGNLNTRRNKIGLRIDKLVKEARNITDANARGFNEAERRYQERSEWLEQAGAFENNLQDRVIKAVNENKAKHERIHLLQAQLRGFAHMLSAANGMSLEAAPSEPGHGPFRPQSHASSWTPSAAVLSHYPTGIWTGSSGDLAPLAAASSSQPSPHAWHPPPTAPSFEPRAVKSRGRSSSMLSDVSGFTEPSDEDSFKSSRAGIIRPDGISFGGNGTSGSSGSAGSGSVGEPASPR